MVPPQSASTTPRGEGGRHGSGARYNDQRSHSPPRTMDSYKPTSRRARRPSPRRPLRSTHKSSNLKSLPTNTSYIKTRPPPRRPLTLALCPALYSFPPYKIPAHYPRAPQTMPPNPQLMLNTLASIISAQDREIKQLRSSRSIQQREHEELVSRLQVQYSKDVGKLQA